jgi:hypothetical protein
MKEEICYFCLECLGTNFYISALELKDGTEAWLHIALPAISVWNTAAQIICPS